MSPEHERALRMCKPKIKYALLSTAQKKAEQSSEKSGERIEPYKCEICGSYHIGHPKEYDMNAPPIQEMNLAKVRDPLGNHYIFSLAGSEALNRSTEDIYSKGVLVAYKKGKDPFKERGGARSNHWRIFQSLFPRFVQESDTVVFLEIIQNKMGEMGAIGVKREEELVGPVENEGKEVDELKSAPGNDEARLRELAQGRWLGEGETSKLSTEELLSKLREMSAPGSGISGDYFKGFVHGVLICGIN